MKVLVIEDNLSKLEEAKYILKELGIEDIDDARSIMDAEIKIKNNTYELIICDLGLPLRIDEEVESPVEGLMYLYRLAYKDIFIKTIINSTTYLPENYTERLKQLDFPLLGQATNAFSLKSLIESYLKEETPTRR